MSIHRPAHKRIEIHLLTSCQAMGLFGSPAAAAEVRQFDIGAPDLASGLRTYGAQSAQQILFAWELVDRGRSHSVPGRLSPEAALEILLRDTGLCDVESTARVLTLQATWPAMIRVAYSAKPRAVTSVPAEYPAISPSPEQSDGSDEIILTARRRWTSLASLCGRHAALAQRCATHSEQTAGEPSTSTQWR